MSNNTAICVRPWHGVGVTRRSGDGYVSATTMCRAGGRRWHDYIRSDRSGEYVQALAGSTGIPADLLAQTVTTGPNHLRGTWVHPRLAVDLARWISPAFAVWMDGWLLEELQGHKQQQTTGTPAWLEQVTSKALSYEAGIAHPNAWRSICCDLQMMLEYFDQRQPAERLQWARNLVERAKADLPDVEATKALQGC